VSRRDPAYHLLTSCAGEQVSLMTKQQPGMTPGLVAYGHLRASAADRDRAVDLLGAAFAQGRLTRAEFDARAAQALTAQTYADLAAALPADPAEAQPPPRAPRKALSREARSSAGAAALAAAAWLATFLTDNAAVFLIAVVITVCAFLASPLANSLLLDSSSQKNPGKPLPPPPAPTPHFMRGPE
jgi:hypothetical protein